MGRGPVSLWNASGLWLPVLGRVQLQTLASRADDRGPQLGVGVLWVRVEPTKNQIVFVQMPFASVDRPSLAIGLLQSSLRKHGFGSLALYANLILAELMGLPEYDYIMAGYPANDCLLGEWLFAPWLDTRARADDPHVPDDAYLMMLLDRAARGDRRQSDRPPEDLLKTVHRTRSLIPLFLDRCLAFLDWTPVRLVGFSSTFQQHVASLVLARELKRHFPHLFVVFGGANVQEPMGRTTLACFHQVDAVVSGEADETVAVLAKAVISSEPVEHIPGVKCRSGVEAPDPLMAKIGDLPYPEYDDYFAQLPRQPSWDNVEVSIPFETSRGCWWGQKHQCTFCGLNGRSLRFRSKSPSRAAAEISYLWRRYGERSASMTAADNVMDWRYPGTLMPKITEAQLSAKRGIFFEVRASLKKGELASLVSARVLCIQIGVESLSSRLLGVMNKGTTALTNVQALKWCLELGIAPAWNLLWGFPGECTQDYEDSISLARKITHLEPPAGFGPVRLDRYSPLFEQAYEFGLPVARAAAAYDAIYWRWPPEVRRDLAYHFDYPVEPVPVIEELSAAIDAWRRKNAAASLFFLGRGNGGIVVDARDGCIAWTVDSRYLSLLRAIDAICTRSSLSRLLGVSRDHVDKNLAALIQRNWAIAEKEHVLGLAVEVGAYQPPPTALWKLRALTACDGPLRISGHLRWT